MYFVTPPPEETVRWLYQRNSEKLVFVNKICLREQLLIGVVIIKIMTINERTHYENVSND